MDSINQNSKIYRFKKVHFSNCLGHLRGLPRCEPLNRSTNETEKGKLVCKPSGKECMFWNVHIDTFDKCTKMFKIVMLMNANFDSESYEILVTLGIGGRYI